MNISHTHRIITWYNILAFVSLKTASCHNAKFAVNDGTKAVVMTACGANRDDNVNIMDILIPNASYPTQIEDILPKGSYPPCLRMADGALLAGYPRNTERLSEKRVYITGDINKIIREDRTIYFLYIWCTKKHPVVHL